MDTSTPTTAITSNVQLIQQAFEDFSKGNIAAIVDMCSDDVEWGTFKVPNAPFSGMHYGKEGVQEYFSELGRTMNFKNFEPKQFVAQGDMVVAFGHASGTVKETGKTFDNDWCFYNKLRNGKLTHWFSYTDSYDTYRAFQE